MKKLEVIALRPVSLWPPESGGSKEILHATEEDVESGKVFKVPDTDFWRNKLEREYLLAYAQKVVKGKIKEKTDEEI